MGSAEFHEFTAILDREPADDELDLLYEAGFDDSTPEQGDGEAVLHIHREAPALAAAILSVVTDAAVAGFRVIGIEDADHITIPQIAYRLGRTPESVRLLALARRGPGGFPRPVGGGRPAFYSWVAVAEWFTEHYGTPIAVSERHRTIAAANHLLQARALLDAESLAQLAPLVA